MGLIGFRAFRARRVFRLRAYNRGYGLGFRAYRVQGFGLRANVFFGVLGVQGPKP